MSDANRMTKTPEKAFNELFSGICESIQDIRVQAYEEGFEAGRKFERVGAVLAEGNEGEGE